jgi:hypothetical protein
MVAPLARVGVNEEACALACTVELAVASMRVASVIMHAIRKPLFTTCVR